MKDDNISQPESGSQVATDPRPVVSVTQGRSGRRGTLRISNLPEYRRRALFDMMGIERVQDEHGNREFSVSRLGQILSVACDQDLRLRVDGIEADSCATFEASLAPILAEVRREEANLWRLNHRIRP